MKQLILALCLLVPFYSHAETKAAREFFWPLSSDYWTIGLDTDYRYAVVWNKTGTTLWILSRTPELKQTLLTKALTIATNNGIDITSRKPAPTQHNNVLKGAR